MKKIVLIFSFSVILSACSSAPEEPSNGSALDSNSAVSNTVSANSNVSAPPNANSQIKTLKGIDPSLFNKASEDTKNVNPAGSNVKAPLSSRPAPDDSELLTKGLPDGSFAETRTFKNHPQLFKVEKVTNGKNTSMKVYLKNGKSFSFTEEQISNFRVAPAQDILLAVGIKPVAPAAPPRRENSETKGEKDTKEQ